jgi:hypothetical protein
MPRCGHPGESEGVDLVVVAGQVVYEGGPFTRFNRDAVLQESQSTLRPREYLLRRCPR